MCIIYIVIAVILLGFLISGNVNLLFGVITTILLVALVIYIIQFIIEIKNDNYLGLKVVCFLLPIVGLIVYAVNIVQNPEIAKPCGQCALIGFVIGLIVIGFTIAHYTL